MLQLKNLTLRILKKADVMEFLYWLDFDFLPMTDEQQEYFRDGENSLNIFVVL